MDIEIDFEAYKALTALRETESVSANDVIRRLLKLPPTEVASPEPRIDVLSGYMAGGRYLPNGTKLQASYKGHRYRAEIKNGTIVSTGGKLFKTLSAAARDVTGNNVNGLRFWQAKRPTDNQWLMVAGMVKKSPHA